MKSIRKSIVFTPITAIVWLIAVNCLIFSSCEKDDVFDVNQPKYSDNQYAIMLRSKVEKQTGKSGTFKNSLIIKHGLPLWENAKWVKTNTGRVLVVPLLSGSPNMKNLIGIIEDNEIIPVITELPVSGHESKKIYSIYNQILYDSKIGIIPTIRLKSASVESDDVTLEGLLTDVCGTAADLFNASNTGCSYNPYETFGTIRICTGGTDGGSSASWSTDGHAWIEITTYSGQKITFSLWGNRGPQEYWVNQEINYYSSASMSSSLTYGQFQNILNYNANCSNLDWSFTNTCAGYSVGIWNTATGSSIDLGYVTTPGELYNYINNH